MQKQQKTILAVLGAYTVLTLAYLFPLLQNFGGLAGHGDVWQFVWNLWWIDYAPSHGQSIWYTTMLHWPQGIPLILQTFTLTSSLPAVLLAKVVGFVHAYNIMVFLHFVFSGLGMYLLCYHVSRNRFAAFVGGFLFAFSPYRFAHYYGHLHLLTTELLPFAILFLIRTLEGKKHAWIGATAFCILTAYADLYYFLFLFIVCAALVLWYRPRTRFVLMRLALVAGLTALAVLPYLLPLISATQTPDFKVPGHDAMANANSWSDLLLPGGRSMFQMITMDFWKHEPGWRENGSYIGYVVLALIAWGTWRVRTRAWWFWLTLGAFFLALTFPVPYLWFERLVPFMKIAGVPLRFFVITSLSMAILASMALARQRKFIALLFLVFLAFEYLPAPVEVSPVVTSPFYHELRRDSEEYAILDISDAPAKVLYYQTIHQHPLIGGYTTRPTVSTNTFLAETNFEDASVLKQLHVRYVLVPSGAEYSSGLREVYTDEFLSAYRVY